MTGADPVDQVRLLLREHDVGESVVGAVLDVVRGAIDEAREREEEYRALARAGSNGVTVTVDYRFVDVDSGFLEMTGYAREQVVGGDPTFLVGQDALETIQQHIESGSTEPYEIDLIRADGSTIPVEVRGRNATWRGRAARLTGYRDLSPLREAERSLAETRARLHDLADLVPVAMVEVDRQERVTFANDSFAELFRLEQPEGTEVMDLIAPEDYERARETEAGRLQNGPEPQEYEMRRPDGTRFPGLAYARPIERGGEVVGYRAVVVDLSAQKASEERRRALDARRAAARRMESLGVLVGGLAHDFNNLLAQMLGNAEIALEDAPRGTPLRECLRRLRDAAEQGAALTSEMLSAAGHAAPGMEPVEVAEAIGWGLADVPDADEQAEVALPDDLPPVSADPDQIAQVVAHLFTNAVQAVAGGGSITIRAHCDAVDEPRLASAGTRLGPGDYVCLEVTDTGVGMSDDELTHACDPFFSTRFAGQGLGLAAVLGIVQAHRTALEIESAPGEGTTVRVWWPVAMADEGEEPAAPAPAAEPDRARVVLVIDDEPGVREIARLVLERDGWQVVEASDGESGVEALRARSDEVAAVLLDLSMPGMDGVETLQALRVVVASLPVVLTTGYLPREAAQRFGDHGPDAYLKKPFDMKELQEAVARVARAG